MDLNLSPISLSLQCKVSLCIEGVDLNFVNRVHWDIKHVSLCIEGVDLNTDPQVLSAADGCLPLHRGSGFKLLCILQEMVINSVSLCIEGVDLNNIVVDLVDLVESLPLHRGSGFKHFDRNGTNIKDTSPSA